MERCNAGVVIAVLDRQPVKRKVISVVVVVVMVVGWINREIYMLNCLR